MTVQQADSLHRIARRLEVLRLATLAFADDPKHDSIAETISDIQDELYAVAEVSS